MYKRQVFNNAYLLSTTKDGILIKKTGEVFDYSQDPFDDPRFLNYISSLKQIEGKPEDFSYKVDKKTNRQFADQTIYSTRNYDGVDYVVKKYKDIYGKDGELKRDVILDILPGQERPDVDDYLRFIHPISIYATDSYIYTLNLDMTTEEIENRKTTPNIQVFDWEGKPLTQYKLDCFINTFVVDEVANKIYGAFVEDEDHIYVFNLPRL